MGSTTMLYLRQPRQGLPGFELGQVVEVINSVYGLPDAPRAWFDALVSVLLSLGWFQSKLDPVLFLWWY